MIQPTAGGNGWRQLEFSAATLSKAPENARGLILGLYPTATLTRHRAMQRAAAGSSGQK